MYKGSYAYQVIDDLSKVVFLRLQEDPFTCNQNQDEFTSMMLMMMTMNVTMTVWMQVYNQGLSDRL